MKNPKLISKPFAQNGQKNVIPEKYETSMESNQATWDQGFGQITMLPVSAGGLPPKGQDFNGILNQMCETIVHISKGGVFKFSADYATAISGYPKGAILQSEDEKKYYQSLIDNNKVNFNAASQDQIKTSWKLVMTDDLLDQLSKKLESSAVVQSTGTSTTSVMSQKASTDSFQPQGNYADKSSKELQRFNSGVFVVSGSAIASTIDGKEAGVIINNNEPCLYSRYSSTGGYRFIKIPERNGEMSLAGDSYTKIESDNKYQPKGIYPTTPEMNVELNKKLDKANISQQLANDVNKVPSLDLVTKELGGKQAKGNYQPAGNYADKGDSYTKIESNDKYQLKGNYADKTSKELQTFMAGVVTINGGAVASTIDGKEAGVIINNEEPCLYSRYSKNGGYRFIKIPERNGEMSLAGDSYTKIESDNKYQLKGNYGLKNTALKSQNGWWKCGDTGLIYQWGRKYISYDDFFIDLPIAFPSTIGSVSIVDYDGAKTVGINLSKSTLSKIATEMTAPNIRIMWLAVGY